MSCSYQIDWQNRGQDRKRWAAREGGGWMGGVEEGERERERISSAVERNRDGMIANDK